MRQLRQPPKPAEASLSVATNPFPAATAEAAPQSQWHNGHVLGCESWTILSYNTFCADGNKGFGLPLSALQHGVPHGGLPQTSSPQGSALLLLNKDDATLHGLFRWKPGNHFSGPNGMRCEAFERQPVEGGSHRPLEPWEWSTILPGLSPEVVPLAIPGTHVDALQRMMLSSQAAPKPPTQPFQPLGAAPAAAQQAAVLTFMRSFREEDQAPMAHVQPVVAAPSPAAVRSAPPAPSAPPTPPTLPAAAPPPAAPKPQQPRQQPRVQPRRCCRRRRRLQLR